MVFPKIMSDVLPFLRRSCSLCLGPLFHCFFQFCPMSLLSEFSGFLAQPCPWLVPDNSVPYAVQEWHGGETILRQWQTSSGTHHCPGSISSADCGALRLDAGLHTIPSVLQKFPLRPLP
jgi:hypothetical protein